MSNRTELGIAQSEFVRAAIAIDNGSLQYRIEMNPDEALQFVSCTSGYNAFSSEDLATLITEIGKTVPTIDYGPSNPNTGRATHNFAIGNECSRVIYLNIDAYPLMRKQGEPVDWDLMRRRLETLAAIAHADEIDWTEQGEHRWQLRMWWD